MRTLILFLLYSGVAFAAASKPKPASTFQIRKFETQSLDNGLNIIWINDNSLPYVSMQMMIKSGSGQDPVGKEGVAGFTAAMLDKGTPKNTALKIADDLEQDGSSFGVNVEPDYTMVTFSALSFNKVNALKQFSEILFLPTFPHAEIERQRKLTLGGLQKLADRPEAFSEYLMPKFMFGHHPYGHESSGTPKSVKVIRKFDIEQYYANFYQPGNAVLAVVGQYDDAWKKSLVEVFAKWKVKRKPELWDPGQFPNWQGTDVLLVDRADLNQAQIQIGFKGIPRNIPEYLELRAALKILGESFGSRLFDEIREKRGLTYHIRAWFDPRLQPGPMGIYTFTRLDKISETVEETLKVYRQFVNDGVHDSEVSEVKALMRGQFPRMFETPEALAQQILLLNRYGVSVDYLNNYFAALDSMTKESINTSIKKYFDVANLKVLVYAPKDKAVDALKKLGKVEIKNYKEFLQ